MPSKPTRTSAVRAFLSASSNASINALADPALANLAARSGYTRSIAWYPQSLSFGRSITRNSQEIRRCRYRRSCALRRAAAKALSASADDLGGGALVRGPEAWPLGRPLGAAVRLISPDRIVRL